MATHSKITLRIPPQDLGQFTLFTPNAEAALEWAQALPVTNVNEVVGMLTEALRDLNRLSLPPQERFSILEALFLSVEVALSNLAKRFLNQPLVMPAHPMEMAELSTRLLTMAGTAYTIVAAEAIKHRDTIEGVNPARLTCEAIQRALIYAGAKVLQTYQLSRPLEIRGWNTLHQLYALAETQQLVDLPIPDPRSGSKTIKTTYLRALLLGCSRPNHLRQSDLSGLWHGLQDWADIVQLDQAAAESSLFLVDLSSDQPPLYCSLYKNEPGPDCRFVNTNALVNRLQALKLKTGNNGLQVGDDTLLPATLLDHMITSLGSMSSRNFKRMASSNEIMISVGLSSSHFQLAGQLSFDQVLYGRDYRPGITDKISSNPFLAPTSKGDIWQKANPREYYGKDKDKDWLKGEQDQAIDLDYKNPLEDLEKDDELGPQEHHEIYKVNLADASPGGYCLEWGEDIPTDIKAGDIVTLKEDASRSWSVGVIRWLSHLGKDKTLLGLELLSPRAIPFGASIRHSSGDKAPPSRVLVLPEIKQVGQPLTIITPKVGFRERQKMSMGNYQERYAIQLLNEIDSTASFSQFEYQYLSELGDSLAKDESNKLGSDGDILWEDS